MTVIVYVPKDLWLTSNSTPVGGGCLQWTSGRLNTDGYGRVCVDGRRWKAHRFAYELVIGPIPEGLVIDHLCRNRACINPEHMEPVTIGENVRRGNALRRAMRLAAIDPEEIKLRADQPRRGVAGTDNGHKTHCPQGHPYDEANTIPARANGGRRCRTCRRKQLREATRRSRDRRLVAESKGSLPWLP